MNMGGCLGGSQTGKTQVDGAPVSAAFKTTDFCPWLLRNLAALPVRREIRGKQFCADKIGICK